ncbi:hypothetical protein BGZ65_006065 [Modicella reniformis]|uniref:WD40 repeat-like protein n=1 Tax=Modicella reniformis TaxID=1440133 RepID=A0A9P6SPC3_9FUNG|nr:hypothetical protein BGZ65_006065 [Modicella reniformis]
MDDIAAETILKQLGTNVDPVEQGMNQAFSKSIPLKLAVPPSATPSLLDRIQDMPDIETRLRRLRKQRLKDWKEAMYVPLYGKTTPQDSDKDRFQLMDKVKEFLSSDQKVFVLVGDSGSGKTTFSRALECDLWSAYKKADDHIPLYIDLFAIDRPKYNIIGKRLRKVGFTEVQSMEMMLRRKFVLIFDHYDDIPQLPNFYTSNQSNQPGEWSAKMVIGCHTDYLRSNYHLQQAVITPFSEDQVQDYIKRYLSTQKQFWTMEQYLKALHHSQDLRDLFKTPLLLSLSLEVFPYMIDPGRRYSTMGITKVSFYDTFVEHWLENSKERLEKQHLRPQARATFEKLTADGFTMHGINYMKNLAVEIYKNQRGFPVVEYSRIKDKRTWKDDFFGQDDEKQLLYEACPLKCSGSLYQFIHPSILEYSLSLAVFDPQKVMKITESNSILSRRGSASSFMSFEMQDNEESLVSSVEQGPDPGSPLSWRNFVNEPSILQFLEERVRQEPPFKQQLLGFIEASKKDKKWRTAAANSITILIRAGVQFIGADLRGIMIPGADLSHGIFDSAQLQGADLRKVILHNAWLFKADLSKAQMDGVQFGELPYLLEASEVYSCAYSPDGTSFAVGLKNSNISVYTTSDWKRIRILRDHSHAVNSVVYSTRGDMIASSSDDKTVRLWVAETGVCRKTFNGHNSWVNSAAFSPNGDLVASGGSDKTVQLWNVDTGTCKHTFSGHSNSVWSVVFSPNGELLATGSEDKTVRLWDTDTGNRRNIFSGHSGGIRSVVFSPKGDLIASGSSDHTVRLWDVETQVCRHTLSGHSGLVKSVVFSPRGDMVASGSDDSTVRLWDVETQDCQHVFSGHSHFVRCVTFSSNGDHIISGSHDKTVQSWDVATRTSRHAFNHHSKHVMSVLLSPKYDLVASGYDMTVRLWDERTGASQHTFSGHIDYVSSVALSPKGDMIATGCDDRTVRVCDIKTGTRRHAFGGHTGYVRSVVFSPNGDLLASGSHDKAVRLWDMKTAACRHILIGHSDRVISVIFSSKGDLVASGSDDKTLRLWKTETGKCQHIFSGHSGNVRSVAFSSKGDQIVSGSDDKTVRIWDVETGNCRHTFSGHNDRVNCVVFSPNGDRIVSGSDDKTVRLWNASYGECHVVIESYPSAIDSIAWCSESGVDFLVVGGNDGLIRLWQVNDVRLRWSSTPNRLVLTNTTVQGVRGLSMMDKNLLKQRDAVGEPL